MTDIGYVCVFRSVNPAIFAGNWSWNLLFDSFYKTGASWY